VNTRPVKKVILQGLLSWPKSVLSVVSIKNKAPRWKLTVDVVGINGVGRAVKSLKSGMACG
jgi:hypothetical protein